MVDDSAASRQQIRYILSQEGMDLDFADSFDDAETKLRSSGYDLVIIDEEVEGFDDKRLLGTLPGPGADRILSLLFIGSETAPEEALSGCNGIDCRRISKPFSTDTLRSAVHRFSFS